MRTYLVMGGIAAVLVSAPAAADDNQWYASADVGVLLPRDTEIDIMDTTSSAEFDNAVDLQYNTGFEIGGALGYDFGAFKVEGELGYKHAGFDAVDPSTNWITFLQNNLPGTIVNPADIDLDGDVDIISTMVNGLVDIGPDDGFGGYIGGGAGIGWAKAYGETEGSFAWQAIAGVRYPITPQIDIGLKYRYFDLSSLDWQNGVDVEGEIFDVNLDGSWRSHSVLADVTFGF